MTTNPSYGLMGGREEFIVEMLLPNIDWQEPFFLNGTDAIQAGHLNMTAKFIPYKPGQYLWDYMDYALEHYSEKISESYLEALDALIQEILMFSKRTDRSRNRPSTIKFVDSITYKFNNSLFSDALSEIWMAAEHSLDIDNYEPYPLIYKSMEKIAKSSDPISIKKQKELISQWNQI